MLDIFEPVSRIGLILLFSFLMLYSYSQRTVSTSSMRITPMEQCGCTESKKAEKKLEEAMDRKNDKDDRLEALRETIEEDPECAEAHYLLGLELLRSAISRGSSFSTAEKELEETVRL